MTRINRDMTTDGKTVLVTGASSGIGRHIALTLRDRGYRVAATARQEADLAALEKEGILAISLELTSSESVRKAARAALDHFDGRLFALVNNAAYAQPGAVEDLSREALTAQFEANFFGQVELTNLLLPAMRSAGAGRIVMISSVLGLVSLPYRGAYNASKYALEAISDAYRLELQGSGVHMALVEPGPILSRFRENSLKAFHRHIDPEKAVHKKAYQGIEERLSKKGAAVPFTLGPEAVTAKVIHAIESPRPKIRYYVTFPTHLFGLLRRLLPYSLLDRIIKSRLVSR